MSHATKLLEEINLTGTPVEVRYERAIHLTEGTRAHMSVTLLCARSSTRLKIHATQKGSHEPLLVGAKNLLWIPANAKYEIEQLSAIADLLTLTIDAEYFTSMIADNGLDRGDRTSLEKTLLLIRRTKWLDDILDRYFFERILNRNSPPGCTFFLEKQILNEIARILFQNKMETWSTKSDGEKSGFDAALRFMETNLFEPLDLQRVAEAAKISESSLLRYFKQSTGKTPAQYLKERRLDEAHTLLEKNEHTVGDVALLVGYEDFSAFGKAFRTRFGKKPSELKQKS